MGLAGCVEGIDAQRVVGYTLFKAGETALLTYPTPADDADLTGVSFHNGRFVQRLRFAAAGARGVVLRQGTAKRLLSPTGGAWTDGAPVGGVAYRRAGEETDRAALGRLTVVCDGMYSSLRSSLTQPDIAAPSYFVGLLLSGAALPKERHAAVVLADAAPILFYPISSTEVRCLVDVPGDKLPSASTGALGAHLASLAPQVPPSLRAPFLEAVAAGRFRSMQNKLLASTPLVVPGALLLGDSANMRCGRAPFVSILSAMPRF